MDFIDRFVSKRSESILYLKPNIKYIFLTLGSGECFWVANYSTNTIINTQLEHFFSINGFGTTIIFSFDYSTLHFNLCMAVWALSVVNHINYLCN